VYLKCTSIWTYFYKNSLHKQLLPAAAAAAAARGLDRTTLSRYLMRNIIVRLLSSFSIIITGIMGPKISPKDKAAEKQMQVEAERDAKSKAAKEKEDAATWAVGAKSSSKAKEAEDKEAEKLRKAAEKAALQAAEDAELGNIVRVVKTKKVGKDDFDMLNAALSKQPKTKAQKDAEIKKKAEEERRKKEAEARELKEQKKKVMSVNCCP